MKIIDFLCYAIDGRSAKRLVLLIQSVVLLMLVGCRSQLASDINKFQAREEALRAAHAAELAEIKSQAEAGVYITGYLPERAEGDIWPLACWLGALERNYPGLSNEAKALACWVVFNRVDSPDYPDDLEMVLLQGGQFSEYNPDGEVTDGNWAIASNQISRWMNGGTRPCNSGAIYITVSSDGVELRDNWDENSRCNRWVA